MKRPLKKIASPAIAALLISAPFLLFAEANPVYEIDQSFAISIRIFLILLFVTAVLIAFIALMLQGHLHDKLRELKGPINFTGRDVSEGKREVSRIFIMGILLIVGVFVVSFNPFPTTPEYAAAAPIEEPEDWTEPAESAIAFSTMATDIEEGKVVFAKKCSVCHGESGEGEIGPNLLDDYWKYGGSANDVYATIANGIEGTTMVPWKAKITPQKRLQLMAYFNSMKGKVEGKAAEGDLYVPVSPEAQ